MIHKKVADNPLKTRKDLQNACADLITPLLPWYSPGKAMVNPGSTEAHYANRYIGLEGFARAMWGLVPLLAGGGDFKQLDTILEGLKNGSDPNHPEYWGTPNEQTQVDCEMTAFGLALAIASKKLFEPLDAKTKANLTAWLGNINKHFIQPNNWQFFRVLTNLGLRNVGAEEYDEKVLTEAISIVDSMYVADGWYNDGSAALKCRQRDYYNPFAIHFYGLIYAGLANDVDPEHCKNFKDRATAFAKEYLYWYAKNGPCIPFGRSLTYRFAQAAFWSGLAFADVEALPWGEIKGILLRHLRWWFSQPIFTESGVLTIGYAYPTLNMAEQYNSPSSPYWAFKSLLALAVPEDHPFWQAEELPLNKPKKVAVQKTACMILCDSEETGHTFNLNAGQWSNYYSLHFEEKYEKFAYSTYFGFNIITGTCELDRAAPDSMLLLCEKGDEHFRTRRKSTDHFAGDGYLTSKWQAWPDVEVQTWLIATEKLLPWHIRIHRIVSQRDLLSAEGGFAVPRGDASYPPDDYNDSGEGFCAFWEKGFGGIIDCAGSRAGEIAISIPNTNLVHPRTVVPVLRGEHPKGESWLVTMTFAHPDTEKGKTIWKSKPDIKKITGDLPADIQKILKQAM